MYEDGKGFYFNSCYSFHFFNQKCLALQNFQMIRPSFLKRLISYVWSISFISNNCCFSMACRARYLSVASDRIFILEKIFVIYISTWKVFARMFWIQYQCITPISNLSRLFQPCARWIKNCRNFSKYIDIISYD